MASSPVGHKYDELVDRESAYEMLQNRAVGQPSGAAQNPWGVEPAAGGAAADNPWGVPAGGNASSRRIGGAAQRAPRSRAASPPPQPQSEGGGITDMLGSILTGGSGRRQSPAEALVKSAMRSVGSNVGRQVGNAIVRGVLGSIMKR